MILLYIFAFSFRLFTDGIGDFYLSSSSDDDDTVNTRYEKGKLYALDNERVNLQAVIQMAKDTKRREATKRLLKPLVAKGHKIVERLEKAAAA